MININKKLYSKLSVVIIIALLFSCSSYAKQKGDPEFPDKPVDQSGSGEGHAEAIIYSPQKGLTVKSPLNPTPSTIDEEEKKIYDTYYINIDTIPKRVEYFSPTYVYARSSAETSILGSLGSSGVSAESSDSVRQVIEDYKDKRKTLTRGINTVKDEITTLKKNGATDDDPAVGLLRNQLIALNANKNSVEFGIKSYSGVRATFNYNLNMVRRAAKVAKLDSVKKQLSKSMITAYLSLKQLDMYEKTLKKQVELYERMYKLQLNNMSLGLSTYTDVENAKLTLDTTKDSYNEIKIMRDNVENQLLVNLGYNLSDKNKIIYVEPEINKETILLSKSSSDAIYGNSEYKSAEQEVLNSKNRGDDYSLNILNRYKNEVGQNVITEIDDLYEKLKAAYVTYEGSLYLKEAYILDVQSAKTKKEQGLVSEIEGIGLDVQNLATEMSIYNAKYNLLTAYYNYYYSVN